MSDESRPEGDPGDPGDPGDRAQGEAAADGAHGDRLAQKDAIIEAALAHAAFDGWSTRTLTAAAADAGIDIHAARRLFPGGGTSLLDWLDGWLDRRMLAACAQDDLAAMPVRRRIAVLVRTRLQLVEGHEEALRRATLARGMPWAAGAAARGVWQTADRIWEAAGFPDSPADGVSRHTRRALLVGILVATRLYWLDDPSVRHADTWSFLDRRIDDALRIGRASAGLGRWFGGLRTSREQPATHA